MEHLIARCREWLARRQPWHCDGCDGTFRLDVMSPCSGDWWLCPKCMKEAMDQDSSPTP